MNKRLEITYRDPRELKDYERNSRVHSEEQIERIEKSIDEFGYTNPILVWNDTIVGGHARKEASINKGLEKVPTIDLSHLTEEQMRAYVIADNRLAELSDWDYDILNMELLDLEELDFDVTLTGFDLDFVEDEEEEEYEGEYTEKIEAPIYEMTGDKPDLSELLDTSKAKELEAKILQADIPDDVRDFLIAASKRHYVFSHDKIAEYYAHASKEVQELMEESALVIIDYDKAIEYGFVRMNKKLLELREKEEAEDE